MTCPSRPSLPYLWAGRCCRMPATHELDDDGMSVFTPDERVWFDRTAPEDGPHLVTLPYDCTEDE